ncbi:MAG: flagellar basal body P-ring formation protein FlgA [Alphaproteobacteria bacterium]|nr:flagellar basal body P-ring formation protein FlgA [Alphaproteobacteria bacterium]
MTISDEALFTDPNGRAIRRIFFAIALFLVPSAVLLIAGIAFAAESPQVRIVVPAHDIMRGEVIGDSDLTYAQVSGTALPATTVTKFDVLTGMQARRMLRAGESIRPDDVRRPVVVSKGQAVTMSFSAPGVELTAMGRAMSEGGVGDTVTVQNPVSFRMVNAMVTGPGAVRAADPSVSPITTARK